MAGCAVADSASEYVGGTLAGEVFASGVGSSEVLLGA